MIFLGKCFLPLKLNTVVAKPSLLSHSTILLGTWVCSMLFALVTKEAWFYFKNFTQDSWVLKGLVIVTLCSDTVSLTADYADVYLVRILDPGHSLPALLNPVFLA